MGVGPTALVGYNDGGQFVPVSSANPLPISGGSYLQYIGTSASPVTDDATARPTTDGPVYWICANGVTPTNAIDGDIIFNASA